MTFTPDRLVSPTAQPISGPMLEALQRPAPSRKEGQHVADPPEEVSEATMLRLVQDAVNGVRTYITGEPKGLRERIAADVEAIKARGGVVELPFEIPDPNG